MLRPFRALRTLAGLAWREGRTARRGLALSMSAIALGVAALVSIDSFASNVTRSIVDQSRTLMGGDIQITARRQLSKPVEQWLDSLSQHDIPNTRTVNFASMALVERTGGTRFANVNAVGDEYPFYGDITTTPPGLYQRLHDTTDDGLPVAIVDPSFLSATESEVGDTLTLGNASFHIAATLKDVPTPPGLASALGPRIYISHQYLAKTGLLTFGSTAEHIALLKLPSGTDPDTFIAPYRPFLDSAYVTTRTVTQRERYASESVTTLSNFIGIVGLVALLLGGIGVASGVRAFVARKINTVAILRCLGASSTQIVGMYVAQSAAIGLVSAMAGAAIGIALQFGLPQVVAPLLPIDVDVTLEPRAILTGIAIGGWVALIFSLYPLLALRNISPIQTLRRQSDADVLATQRGDPWRILVSLALITSIVGIAVLRAQDALEGIVISLATGAVILVLVLSAIALSFLAKRVLRQQWPYVIRQGLANIYRPGNQTRPVILSLGFGAFLLATLFLVQHSLLSALEIRSSTERANMLFFDVQSKQEPVLDSVISSRGFTIVQRDPVISMRIAEINGQPVRTMATDTVTSTGRRSSWAVRREYRSTFRDSLLGGERLVKGQWFQPGITGDTAEVSLEDEIASELAVSTGDVITWDVQGVRVSTKVTSLRAVQWTRFEPNFFAVFSPSALEGAPHQFLVLASVPGDQNVTTLQRDLALLLPNVSSIDLTLIASTLEGILAKITSAIRFMGLFSLAIGIPVLFSAVAATRRDRIRESVLLKTLGASRKQVGTILITEYAVLGLLGSLTGLVLAYAANWALMRWIFQEAAVASYTAPAAIALAMTAVTVVIGMLASRQVFRETAMKALRE